MSTKIVDKYFIVDEDGTLIALTEEGKQQTQLTIPNSIKEIGEGAFWDCINLKEITFAKNSQLEKIGCYAFKNCTNLQNIIIPESIKEIDCKVFTNCTNLQNIIIPDSVTKIGDWAFENCRNLQNIIIPDSVEKIGHSVFKECKKLTSDSVINNSSVLFDWWVKNHQYKEFGNQTIDQIIKETGTIDLSQFKNSAVEEFSVIGNKSFINYKNLENIIIPNSVTEIGQSAFYGCTNLENIIIPKSLRIIGKKAFFFCKSLKNITIPESVKEIGQRAFLKGTKKLTKSI